MASGSNSSGGVENTTVLANERTAQIAQGSPGA